MLPNSVSDCHVPPNVGHTRPTARPPTQSRLNLLDLDLELTSTTTQPISLPPVPARHWRLPAVHLSTRRRFPCVAQASPRSGPWRHP